MINGKQTRSCCFVTTIGNAVDPLESLGSAVTISCKTNGETSGSTRTSLAGGSVKHDYHTRLDCGRGCDGELRGDYAINGDYHPISPYEVLVFLMRLIRIKLCL